MPRRNDINSILVIGSGPIIIGQACEFDYSGTQACIALKEEGFRVILINSNPATIMTDPSTADRIYIEPIEENVIEQIIKKERPDALLSTVGGQTALNVGLKLFENGVLDKYHVKMIGANAEAIKKAENRQLFNDAMKKIGLDCPKNVVVSSLDEAMHAIEYIGFPAIIRPSFTLAGSGGGIANNLDDLKKIVSNGLRVSPSHQVQIDESLVGWKEYEMEVIRDQKDNAIIVCSIENIDPMGVHTGDSITIAPALTLTDKEYQNLRNASINILREIGVETGGSNVQFAINPKDGRVVVIEMNPRVSRSSALASKATGFPIAKVAAKLAVGYTLDEIKNDITKTTPASFEPTIDYIVTKIPRFPVEKFSESLTSLSTSMQSVGEVMGIGRNFAESIQKALCSLETGLTGFNSPIITGYKKEDGRSQNNIGAIKESLKELSVDRLLRVAEALRIGISVDEINALTAIDPWYIDQVKNIVYHEQAILTKQKLLTPKELLKLKKLGFSDKRLSELYGKTLEEIYAIRKEFSIYPVFKNIDTCAAEHDSSTSYLYSTYEGNWSQKPECEANPSDKKKIIVLGSGPNRIGQGIEFDYTCVHAARAFTNAGYESIMINCNPETVSTDYDTSDRLYFEPLDTERILEIVRKEEERGELLGVIVQFGGQTPLKVANYLQKAGVKILGTSPDKIDLAENRERFKHLLEEINLEQPKSTVCYKADKIRSCIDEINFPVMIRPSNILGGRAIAMLKNEEELEQYLSKNSGFFIDDEPILVDSYLENAIEIDVDAISDGSDVFIAGIMEHIEKAGIHSGDSACSLPPHSLSRELINKIEDATRKISLALEVKGFINIQFAVKDGRLYVIEANPRASRTVPFVAKTLGLNIVNIAALVITGQKLSSFNLKPQQLKYFAVKEVVLPYAKFSNTSVALGPEMKSTGEVMGVDVNFEKAFAKAQLAASNILPVDGTVYISLSPEDVPSIKKIIADLARKGFKCLVWDENNLLDDLEISSDKLSYAVKIEEVIAKIEQHEITMVIETCASVDQLTVRRAAVLHKVCYFTTIEAANLAVKAIGNNSIDNFSVNSLSDFYSINREAFL